MSSPFCPRLQVCLLAFPRSRLLCRPLALGISLLLEPDQRALVVLVQMTSHPLPVSHMRTRNHAWYSLLIIELAHSQRRLPLLLVLAVALPLQLGLDGLLAIDAAVSVIQGCVPSLANLADDFHKLPTRIRHVCRAQGEVRPDPIHRNGIREAVRGLRSRRHGRLRRRNEFGPLWDG